MKIALAFNLNRNNEEFEADFDTQDIIDRLTQAIETRHEVHLLECDKNLEIWVPKLRNVSPDLIFNVTEWYGWLGREAFAPVIFEQLGYRYTGPKTKDLVICQDKNFIKKTFSALGVPTAKSAVVKRRGDIVKIRELAFPVFIKLNGEWSSLGVDERSKASDFESASEKIFDLLSRFESPVLVEEFIPGKDLSVTYVEGIGFAKPMQYDYPKGKEFYDYELKIFDYQEIDLSLPVIPREIEKKILENCREIVEFLEISRYCRIEVRWNPDTWDYRFLEINGQVCFLENGSFVESVRETHDFDQLVNHVIDLESESDESEK